jgi:DNA-directed RNA polymerase specialized sigma24 family protein
LSVRRAGCALHGPLAYSRAMPVRALADAVPIDAGDGADPLAGIAGPRGDEPDMRAGAREQATRIAAALVRLPRVQRDAFLLHQEGGLELAEIAALSGDGVETIKSRIRYALSKLRAELQDLR